MNQSYFIVVLAHSLHGRLRRFHIDQKVVFAVLALALLGCFTLFGMVSSYVRMAWKVSNYNSLRQEAELLRARYQRLLSQTQEANEELARLSVFAAEVSMAYGIHRQPAYPGEPELAVTSVKLTPTLAETLETYNKLRTASLTASTRLSARRWLVNTTPSLWPVTGRLLSNFGTREDPFHGHMAFHTGVDISAPVGTPVKAAADGIVIEADWMGNYGKLIVLDHGKGLQTWYAHLSRIDVIPGQEVRLGQIIGATGATGRATSPHLHYEVRRGGVAVNPYGYLARSALTTPDPAKDFPF
jgi:murein DD-endopeptidase MepM/ murein hydrolase activator NlpD